MGAELTHRHDAIVKLSENEINQITKDAEAVVKGAVKAKDFNHVLDYLGAIGRVEQASWFARAHVLYEARFCLSTASTSSCLISKLALSR